MKKVKTSVRLLESQKEIAEKPLGQRSEAIEQAINDFLAWESYQDEDWSSVAASNPIDGQPWLDSVEVGIEYRTRTKLLTPVMVAFLPDTVEALELAVKRAESARSSFKGKGTKSGIIRAAVFHSQLQGRYGIPEG